VVLKSPRFGSVITGLLTKLEPLELTLEEGEGEHKRGSAFSVVK